MSDIGHVEKDAEYVNRQNRDNGGLYGHSHYLFEAMRSIKQSLVLGGGKAKSRHEGKDECRHHSHQRWNAYREIRLCLYRFRQGLQSFSTGNHRRKECGTCQVRNKSGKDGGYVSDGDCDDQHLSGFAADVSNCRSDESDYDQRYRKTQELAEYGVECDEYSYYPFWTYGSDAYAKCYCNQNFAEKADLYRFHGLNRFVV